MKINHMMWVYFYIFKIVHAHNEWGLGKSTDFNVGEEESFLEREKKKKIICCAFLVSNFMAKRRFSRSNDMSLLQIFMIHFVWKIWNKSLIIKKNLSILIFIRVYVEINFFTKIFSCVNNLLIIYWHVT